MRLSSIYEQGNIAATMSHEYTTTVGIEVHAELATTSKMFCGCKNDPHYHIPNHYVCPVCMAHPGTLPVVNEEAVRLVFTIGTAVGGQLADFSEFDRKNYFYPDIPKAYQISQYKYPFVSGGSLAGVALTRIHLEEDTARSQHTEGSSLVDFNRAGVPLMELVTEPVIHTPEAAGDFARELQLLLRTVGASKANMERGELRVEANISVSKTDELGTKVEVKNLNSFKAVEAAIQYETKRQIAALEAGEEIQQETRGWDDNRSKTFTQRVKESADDYRYFPDPDIPKLRRSQLPQFSDATLADTLPETPDQKRERYQSFSLPASQVEILISDLSNEHFFSAAVGKSTDTELIKTMANYFTSDIYGLLETGEYDISAAYPDSFRALAEMSQSGAINSRVTKDLLPEVVFTGADPKAVADERGLLQQSDSSELQPVVDQIIADNASVVAEYKDGKESVLQFLIGQGMKATKGSANPAVLKDMLHQSIMDS